MVSWEVGSLQRIEFLIKKIQVIEWYPCVCTCRPSLLYQDRILISFPAARSSSNSSSNTPIFYVNEPILFLPLSPKMIFAIHIRTINPREPPQVSSLILTPPFSFTYSTDQRFEYILNESSCHLFSHLIGGTYCGSTAQWINRFLRKFTIVLYICSDAHIYQHHLQ